MNLTAILNVGRLAKAANATARLAKAIGGKVVPVLLELVRLENDISGAGKGERKLQLLLEWAGKQFFTAEQAELVEEFAGAIVAILNALKVFKK